jgi:hypothetical protein
VIRTRVSNYLSEKDGQLALGEGLFGNKGYMTYRELKRRIDPKLEEAAMVSAEYLKSIQRLEESGHLPRGFMTARRIGTLTKYRDVIDWALGSEGEDE